MFTKLNSYGEQISGFTNMSCEACTVKFTLFKRKKQCMDCLHYFCTGCVIKRSDRVLSCDNCSMLSRRPLIKSQIIQMRTRHLRNYLEAKKVNIRGCLEKDDLVNLLILYVNETEKLNGSSQRATNYNDYSGYQQTYYNDRPTYFDISRFQGASTERDNIERRIPHAFETRREDSETNNESNPPVIQNEPNSPVINNEHQENVPQQSQNEISQENITVNPEQNQNQQEPCETVPDVEHQLPVEQTVQDDSNGVEQSDAMQNSESQQMIVEDIDDLEESQRRIRRAVNERVEIEEVTESDNMVNSGPEPVITESEELPEVPTIRESAEMFTEIKTWPDNIKLSDIQLSSDLNQLTTKQLKYLLLANRVDFKGCVERYELLDRVLRLWTEYQQSRKEAENCDMDALCKICLDAPIECVILECGHMACCIDCGKRMAECPICRQYVVRVVRIFRS